MDYQALLHGFDEPLSYAFPMAYDDDDLRKAVESAHRLLESRVDFPLTLDSSPQDASFFGDLLLHVRRAGEEDQDGAAAEDPPRIRFSHFGCLATILQRDELSEPVDRTVLTTLADAGFLFVPETELAAPYSGELPESWGVADWRTRYFGYL